MRRDDRCCYLFLARSRSLSRLNCCVMTRTLYCFKFLESVGGICCGYCSFVSVCSFVRLFVIVSLLLLLLLDFSSICNKGLLRAIISIYYNVCIYCTWTEIQRR